MDGRDRSVGMRAVAYRPNTLICAARKLFTSRANLRRSMVLVRTTEANSPDTPLQNARP